MKCEKCGTDNIDSAQFCSKCGLKLFNSPEPPKKIKCKKCGEINILDAKFCVKCGQKLTSYKKAIIAWIIAYFATLIIFGLFIPQTLNTTIPLFIIGFSIVFIVGILIPILLLIHVIKEIKQAKLLNDQKALIFNKIIFFIIIGWFICAIIGLGFAGLTYHCNNQINSAESCDNRLFCTFRSYTSHCVPGELCPIPLSSLGGIGGTCKPFFEPFLMNTPSLGWPLTIIMLLALFFPVFIFPILFLSYKIKGKYRKN